MTMSSVNFDTIYVLQGCSVWVKNKADDVKSEITTKFKV